MKKSLVLIISLITVLLSCTPVERGNVDKLSIEQQKEIVEKLENIATEFLRSWEPPFHSEKAVELFTQSVDFNLVIDGFVINNYEEWAANVPNFMSDDNYYFASYKHEIKDISTVILSPESGVVSIEYIWDSVSRDSIHERTPGAISFTCRQEDNDWKIVHYHGSHNEAEIIE